MGITPTTKTDKTMTEETVTPPITVEYLFDVIGPTPEQENLIRLVTEILSGAAIVWCITEELFVELRKYNKLRQAKLFSELRKFKRQNNPTDPPTVATIMTEERRSFGDHD